MEIWYLMEIQQASLTCFNLPVQTPEEETPAGMRLTMVAPPLSRLK